MEGADVGRSNPGVGRWHLYEPRRRAYSRRYVAGQTNPTRQQGRASLIPWCWVQHTDLQVVMSAWLFTYAALACAAGWFGWQIKKTPYLIRYGVRILKSESQKMRSTLFRRCDGSQLWGRGGWHGLLGRSNHLRAWHDGFRDNWATGIAGGFSHNHVRNWCALVLMLAEQAVEQSAFRA